MKHYSAKKLYNTTIKRLNNTRFYKGNEAYRFFCYDYQSGVYHFFFCKESDYNTYGGDFNEIKYARDIKYLVNTMWAQHDNDYKDTYERNCKLFDRCELLEDAQEVQA